MREAALGVKRRGKFPLKPINLADSWCHWQSPICALNSIPLSIFRFMSVARLGIDQRLFNWFSLLHNHSYSSMINRKNVSIKATVEKVRAADNLGEVDLYRYHRQRVRKRTKTRQQADHGAIISLGRIHSPCIFLNTKLEGNNVGGAIINYQNEPVKVFHRQ